MEHSEEAASSMPSWPGVAKKSQAAKIKLAVYDLDGTCITGNSPVLLVNYLMRKGLLSFWQGLRIGMWALRYKFRLPQDESSVRSKVFQPFDGKPQAEVDAFLRGFYDEVVEPRWRSAADESMRAHAAEGCFVMVVSATWQAIADRACELHPFECALATRMVVDGKGNYTRQVEGLPVEGEEKLRAVQRFADERFGKDAWVLSHAFGDHHSDRVLLRAAETAHAVEPDNPLERTARSESWEILHWG